VLHLVHPVDLRDERPVVLQRPLARQRLVPSLAFQEALADILQGRHHAPLPLL